MMPYRDKLDNPLIAMAIDTETTGNMPDEDSICQLAAVGLIFESGQDPFIHTFLSTYAKPSIPIKKNAQEVHGITEEMTHWSPPERVAVESMVAEIEYLERQGYDVVVGGHNSERFDFPIIERVFNTNLRSVTSPFEEMLRYDTMRVARRWYPETSHKLGDFYQFYFDKEPVNAHDAAADCWMVCEILLKMLQDHDMNAIEFCEFSDSPFMYEVMPFGKYKGMLMKDVPKSWMEWFKNKSKEPDLDMDFTIARYLK